jgi:Transposase DDE domain
LALQSFKIKPGTTQFLRGVSCTQKHQITGFNLGVTWKRKYRGKVAKQPWYILTNLDSLELTLAFYKSRWGIESMFKDCKSGGYNLERTWVNDTRFLALVLLIAIAYSLATFNGTVIEQIGLQSYVSRLPELTRSLQRHSTFWIGLYGRLWVDSMNYCSELAMRLVALKPHKWPNFQMGLQDLSVIQSTL